MLTLATAAAPGLGGESIGWRGNGSGVHLGVDPPLRWQRVSTAVAGLRFQADPPQGEEPAGQSMADGVIRQWLLLGPVPAQEGGKGALTDALLAEDHSGLTPAAGQELAGAAWKKLNTETAYIDCHQHFGTYGKVPNQVAYAHAYLYSPAAADCIIRVMHTAALHVWLNGKPTHKFDLTELNYTPQMVTLRRGWNRLLLRIAPQHAMEQNIVLPWFANVVLEAAPDKAEYQERGIAWKTVLPSAESFGGPIVVAGKVFLLSGMADVVCLDAATGKMLWLRSNNYHELATDDERRAHPEIFKEIGPLAARLAEVNASFTSPSPPQIEPVDGREEYKEKAGLERKLYALMHRSTANGTRCRRARMSAIPA